MAKDCNNPDITRRKVAPVSADLQYFRLTVANPHHVSDPLSEERSRKRRYVRQRSACWVGLILTDNTKRLFAAIVAGDRHRVAETHL
jgi:hypothetical protein